MPRSKADDLSTFQDWLIEECGMSSRSSSVYASRVRSILRECTASVSEPELQRVMAERKRADNHSCFATSWNRFVDFVALQGGVIPRISSKRRVRKSTIQELPVGIGRTLNEIVQKAHIRINLIPRLRWKDIQPKSGHTWEIRDPERAGLFYTCPSDLMRQMCDWANGIEEIVSERPFVPCHPLGMKPMPLATVRRSISTHRSSRDR